VAGLSLRRGCCEHCGGPLGRFGRCRRRSCPAYRDLWANDWRKVFLANLELVEGVALITVTAPGEAEGLPFDRSLCRHGPDVACSGLLGCRVVEGAARSWNRSAEKRWAALHRAAAERARRRTGRRGWLVAAKGWERQKRGVDHLHLAVPYHTPSQRRLVEAYVRALKELAPKYCFGFVDLQRPVGRGSNYRAAAYLAKYVSKATREQLAPYARRPFYVSQRLTQQTGVTMRACRLKRYLFRVWGCEPLGPGEPWRVLDLYFALWRHLGARPILSRGP